MFYIIFILKSIGNHTTDSKFTTVKKFLIIQLLIFVTGKFIKNMLTKRGYIIMHKLGVIDNSFNDPTGRNLINYIP